MLLYMSKTEHSSSEAKEDGVKKPARICNRQRQAWGRKR